MPPNIVCIVADDLGWRDLGCYGSPFYETPNLDRLASEGARFTDAYASAPVCSPTRASIQSGQYPARVGITNFIAGEDAAKLLEPEYLTELPGEVTTLGDVLSGAGFATWHVGKWHLGGEDDSLPENRGYDVNVAGSGWGMPFEGFFSPYEMPNLDDGPDGEYLTDRLTDEAVDLIRNRDEDEPFFLNLNYYSVHIPIEAKDETIEKYERKRKALGLDDEEEFEVGEAMPSLGKKDTHVVRRLVQSDPTYAAMVQHLDTNVGRILDTLEEQGVAEDTIVIFTSDNGGLATSEGSPTCNKPLSEGKGWMYEGGNRVPLVVRWPGVAESDEMCEEPVTSPDIYSTILDAVDVDPPEDQVIDGCSLRPLFDDGSLDREAIFWHYPHYGHQGGTPTAAIRAGRWKLIEFYEDETLALYDLEEDIREEHELGEYQSDRVQELHSRLVEWREEVDANMPEPNPEFESWEHRQGAGH
jgi:arylsulfatase A-like enzyme